LGVFRDFDPGRPAPGSLDGTWHRHVELTWQSRHMRRIVPEWATLVPEFLARTSHVISHDHFLNWVQDRLRPTQGLVSEPASIGGGRPYQGGFRRGRSRGSDAREW